MSNTELRDVVDVSCSVCTPNGEILLNRYLQDYFQGFSATGKQ